MSGGSAIKLVTLLATGRLVVRDNALLLPLLPRILELLLLPLLGLRLRLP